MSEDIFEEGDAQTVGELLRNARLKQGKTLGDVAKELCIRKVYLEAIENSDYENLPPVPYGIGFVRSYAEFVGLNSQRIVQSYKKTVQPEEDDNVGKNSAESNGDFSMPKFRHILFGICGVLFLAVLWQISLKEQEPEDSEEIEVVDGNDVVMPEVVMDETAEQDAELSDMGLESIAEAEKELAEATAPAETAVTEETPAVNENAPEDVNNDKKNTVMPEQTPEIAVQGIKAVFIGPSWIEVKQNGNVLLSGTYGKGFSFDIPEGENTTVSVGRYYNVDFYVDGRLTKIASSMKQMNIKLDKFFTKKN